jgi:transposase
MQALMPAAVGNAEGSAEIGSDLSQGLLINKILQYLPDESRGLIDERGMCNGLSVLWAYGMYLSDQPNPEGKERDDHAFFLNAQDLLLHKPKHSYTAQDHATVERFIQHIIFFQDWALKLNVSGRQLDLGATLEDTKGRKAVSVIDELDLISNQEFLQRRLERLASIPGNMVFIAATGKKSGHIFSFYKNKEGQITFYDPNSRNGEQLALSSDELRGMVWGATAIDTDGFGNVSIEDHFFRKIKIYVYNFAEPVDFGDLRLTNLEKEEMLENKFLKGYRDDLRALPTAPSTPEYTAELLKKKFSSGKYAEMSAAEQASAIHTELLKTTDISAKSEKIKGFIVSGLSMEMYEIFDYLLSRLISEEDKIEATRLWLAYRDDQAFKKWVNNRNGKEIKTCLYAPFDDSVIGACSADQLRVGGKSSEFDYILIEAVLRGNLNFVKLLLEEIPEVYRPSPEIIGKAIYSLAFYAPSTEALNVVKYLIRADAPMQVKPEPFWLNRAKQVCAEKLDRAKRLEWQQTVNALAEFARVLG